MIPSRKKKKKKEKKENGPKISFMLFALSGIYLAATKCWHGLASLLITTQPLITESSRLSPRKME